MLHQISFGDICSGSIFQISLLGSSCKATYCPAFLFVKSSDFRFQKKNNNLNLNFSRHSSQVRPLSGHADRDSLCLSTCRGRRVRCLMKCIVCYSFFTRASAEHKPCDKLNRPLVACRFVCSLSRVSNSQQFALKI